jgi:hypothetical protein
VLGNVQHRLKDKKGTRKRLSNAFASSLYAPTPTDIDLTAQRRVYVSPKLEKRNYWSFVSAAQVV